METGKSKQRKRSSKNEWGGDVGKSDTQRRRRRRMRRYGRRKATCVG